MGIFSDQDRLRDSNRRSVILCLEHSWRWHLAFCFQFLSMRTWPERRSRVQLHFHRRSKYLRRKSRLNTPAFYTRSKGLLVLAPTILAVATSAATIVGSVTDASQKVIQEVSVGATNRETNTSFCDGRKVLLGRTTIQMIWSREVSHATQSVHEKG